MNKDYELNYKKLLALDVPRLNLFDLAYKLILILLAIVLFFSIALIKSRTIMDFYTNRLFFIYSILVTTFAFSRIISALFYKYSYSKIAPQYGELEIPHPYEPKVSFIIPCKNEERIIAKTVTRCFEVDYPKDKIEVIVINDGSTDDTVTILKELKNKFTNLIAMGWEENRGKRLGMAAGIRRASGEIIVQIDSDSFVTAGSFRNLIAPFQNPKLGAVCAHAEPANSRQNLFTKMQAAYYFVSFRILKAAESTFGTVFCCSGSCSAYRKNAITPILDKWLNETFLGKKATWGDDRALTSWVLKSGYKTIYADNVKAYTLVPHGLTHLLKQQIRWKKSWIVNSFFTSRFIIGKHPFVAFFYFFPLLILSVLTPIVGLRALLYDTIFKSTIPLYYFLGIISITAIILIACRIIDNKNKYWPYFFLWSLLNMFLLVYLMFYSILTLQDRGWGTR